MSVEEKRIAVICGGKSAEREISLKTGQAVYSALENNGLDAIKLDPQANDFLKQLTESEIDIAFIALHGRYGEDGSIQGLLEMEGIPYTGSGVLASALAIDKVVSKRLFKQNGIPTPKFETLHNQDYAAGEEIVERLTATLDLPIVVKPTVEGSSLGLSIIETKENLGDAIEEAFEYSEEIFFEEYIEGREITIGLLGNRNPEVLPIIEIEPKDGVYDFEAKYTKGLTEFVIPARLTEEIYQQAETTALKAYQALNCAGMGRIDLMVSSTGTPYVLEVNTIPGMTETSLLPQAAQAAGIEFKDLIIKILSYAV
ncbi:D-alanine--D-alanine ligase family protein [Fuchsiella alkaliacetigena]|uniref:D-alanine--D-alanine ligase family protein n=1 Tax=Fuchsiella alkaliacetigena TaxID=957042 RepID=UPI00200A9992|nr:D-alanine--D-alanine ligase [Fuchsiella alkaliacetigena]MCK8823669.1 D-alanine--D-alanine ligase [Fuchsiella alkaliacetigena]